MVRIAPVRLVFNPKTLWFDAGELELKANDNVVVLTARGLEFGTLAKDVFEIPYEETKKLKSPLKPVKRKATEEDEEHAEELARKSAEALPEFKRIAAQMVEEMNPVAVEYLFEGDKAVFYFESEDRVDFRELVRKLGSELHVRVDMKQIGVRDEARMVGGFGHCGQELCCRRMGGEFNPVSIRMAKEQDLSLNPQKISGVCGRLMCCLRYEYESYKDFHSRAPKKNAKIQTPDGEGRVTDLDVPREIVSIKVGDEKPVKVPLADMDEPAEGTRPNTVGDEAWERANEPVSTLGIDAGSLFTTQLTGNDKLAEPGSMRRVHTSSESKGKQSSSSKSRSRRRSGQGDQGSQAKPEQAPARKARRRRSTTVSSDGTTQVSTQDQAAEQSSRQRRKRTEAQESPAAEQSSSSRRRRSRSRSKKSEGATGNASQNAQTQQAKPSTGARPGQKSSSLSAGRAAQGNAAPAEGQEGAAKRSGNRRRRRRRSSSAGEGATQQGQQSE